MTFSSTRVTNDQVLTPPEGLEQAPLEFPPFAPVAVEPQPRRRLERERVPLRPGGPRLAPAGQVYADLKEQFESHDLGLGVQPRRRLAAAVTMARMVEQARRDFYAARNRANDVLDEIRLLLNKPSPWEPAATAAARQALARIAADPVLVLWRDPASVYLDAWLTYQPRRRWILDLIGLLEHPGAGARERTSRFSVEFEDVAARQVGNQANLVIDIPQLGRFELPPGRNLQAQEVARWTVWMVTAILENARGSSRRVAQDTSALLAVVAPELSPADEAVDAVSLRRRAWEAFFGGKARRTRLGQSQDCSGSPLNLLVPAGNDLVSRLESIAPALHTA